LFESWVNAGKIKNLIKKIKNKNFSKKSLKKIKKSKIYYKKLLKNFKIHKKNISNFIFLPNLQSHKTT
jgi:hypothetical protein